MFIKDWEERVWNSKHWTYPRVDDFFFMIEKKEMH